MATQTLPAIYGCRVVSAAAQKKRKKKPGASRAHHLSITQTFPVGPKNRSNLQVSPLYCTKSIRAEFRTINMPSKRKAQPLGLERRVRPKKNEDWEPEAASSDDARSEADVSEENIRSGSSDDDEGQSGSESDSEKGSEVTILPLKPNIHRMANLFPPKGRIRARRTFKSRPLLRFIWCSRPRTSFTARNKPEVEKDQVRTRTRRLRYKRRDPTSAPLQERQQTKEPTTLI